MEYKADRQLRSSLEIIKFHILKIAYNTALREVSLIFIRLADRVLYHTTNVWEHFERDLRIPAETLQMIHKDALIQTGDVNSKYEIEAYLGAAKTLFETNLIDVNQPNKKSLLGNCFLEEQEIAKELSQNFKQGKIFSLPLQTRYGITRFTSHPNSKMLDFLLW